MVTEIAVGVLLVLIIFEMSVIYRAQKEGKITVYRTESWLTESQILNPEGQSQLPSIILLHG